MADLALESSGAQVIFATSYDERHPPECIIDGNENSFYLTTGYFPQEFIIAFGAPVQVFKIKTVTANVKRILIERCEGEKPVTFEKVMECDYSDKGGGRQSETHQIQRTTARFLKFVILSGYDEFCAIYSTKVEGTTV
eukprot:tig00000980_g6133.t1